MDPTTAWRAAGDHELTLEVRSGPKPLLRCRTAAGRELKKVPPALKAEPLVQELTALAAWIGDHADLTLASVERWMTQSLPVSAALIRQVWPDPYWQRALRHAVIAPYGGAEGPDVRRAGVLTGIAAGPAGPLLVTGLDGERELHDTLVVIPHPVLLDPRGTGLLGRWHGLLDALGGEQGIEQLHRAVYVRPDCSPAPATDTGGTRNTRDGITVFHGAAYASGARFERLVARFGGRIGGERAGFTFPHRGSAYGMVADLRHQGPAAPVSLHDFRFTDARGRQGPGTYDAVPRPVWSEGIRAIATLFDERDPGEGRPAAALPADSSAGYQSFLVECAAYAAAGASQADAPKPRPSADARQLLDAGAVLAGEPAGPGEEPLTARRYGSPLLEEGGWFVRLVVARAVGAHDAVARTLGLEPDAGGATPVGRASVRPLDFLSRVCRVHPGLARQAMALLAPLRTCATTAETKPGRAAAQLRASLKKLTADHPALLPHALDEGARIVVAAGSVAMARPLYAEARAAEKQLGGIDESALRETVSEFGVLGVVDGKLLGQHRDDIAARTSASEAYEEHRRLVLDWCRKESGIPTSFVRDGVTRSRPRGIPASFAVELAEGAGSGPLAADDTNTEIFHLLLRGGGLEKAAASVWEAWAAPLERDLAEHPDTAGHLRTHLPEPRGSSAAAKTAAAGAWLALLARTGLLEPFTGGTPAASAESAKAANAWLTLFLRRYAGLRLPVAGLEPVVASIAARMREAGERREPLLGLQSETLGGDFRSVGVDLGLLALMKRVGMPLDEPAEGGRVWALQWIQRRGTDGVEPVLADPAFREPIRGELTAPVRGSLGYTVTRHHLTPFPKVTKKVAALEPLRELMAGILDERALRLRTGGEDRLFALQDLLLHVAPFVVAGAASHFDAHVRLALAVEPAALLADTLRAGCLAHGHDGDRTAPCGVREATADHARELLESADAAVRHRHAQMFAVEPATRRSRYLDFREGTPFAQDLLPVIEKTLPHIADDSCRSRALGLLQGVLWCETWQATLRRFVR
ncbi:DUF4132 domain-containing protein [Streptomyces erythrochromogenes]|uniref:DUF4132 domain-containing protein n=1 Tax=Streptomyces erythrochromogenes TaxID=285574 RepID=UPI00224E5E19|nr:DUF4132 domain-containing protein [Streptomyces erythrochromogenes]MCX5588930.1 DUF4132 domain-containing protein [Streptomyces erythrochromogenes]